MVRETFGKLLCLTALVGCLLATPALPAQRSPMTVEPPLADSAPPPNDLPQPVVTIQVRVPAEVAPGKDLEYRITVNNTSRAAAHHVTVRNPVPANTTFVSADPAPTMKEPELVWRLGSMEGCTKKEIVLVLRPTGEGEVQNCARVQFEHGQCVTTRIGRPQQQPAQLSLRKTGPEQAMLFDPLSYRIEVRNNGTAPLTDVVLTDVLPRDMEYVGGTTQPQGRTLLTWNLGTLAAGQQRVIEYQAVTKKPGTFTNLAVVTAGGGMRQESSVRTTVNKPDLSLRVIGPDRRYANLPATYELIVSNTGTTSISNVILGFPIPTGMKVVQATPGSQEASGEVQWNVGNLAPGARQSRVVVLLAQAAGEVTIRATAKADRGIQTSGEMKTMFQGAAGLTGRLTDPDPIAVGQEGTYKFVVKNTGTADATEVKVTAIVPVQFQIGETKGASNARVDGDKVYFEPITLKAGQEATYTISVKALKAGDVRFRVDLEAKELASGPVREEESTTIYDEPR